MPFFRTMSPKGPTGKIQPAVSFSSGLVGLGHRAGYEENIRVHDFRREVLVKADGMSRCTRPLVLKVLTLAQIMAT